MLTVETGVGLTNADSFASVAEADSFWGGRPSGAAWMALTTEAKEGCLREATDFVATKLAGAELLSIAQSLSWPYYDPAPTARDRAAVARATIMAADVARLGPLIGGAAQGGRVLAEDKTLGPLSKSVKYSDRDRPASANGRDLSFVDDLLRGVGGRSTGGLIIGRTARA